MNRTVAIAGGGIIGMSAAWRLAQRGIAVTVFEKGAIGGEASWAGAGMLAPGGEIVSSSWFAHLAIESRSLYPSFVRELETATHRSIDYQECGALDLAYNEAEWEELQIRAQQQSEVGLKWKEISREQITSFWPRVSTHGLRGALFYPGDAIVNPREVMTALAEACRGRGAILREGAPVLAATVLNDGIEVESSEGRERFDVLVIAAGAWSSSIRLLNSVALPEARPVKGQLIGFHQPEQTCNTILRHGHAYLLQRANGLLIAGASVEHAGWDRSIEPAVAESLAREAAFVLPHLAETSPTESWIGFRPASDELHVGPWHSKHLFLAYGHYRNGILLAPITAQTVAREVACEASEKSKANASRAV